MKDKLIATLATLLFLANMVGGASATTITDTTYFTRTGTIDSTDYVDHGRDTVNFLGTSALQALSLDFDYVTWQHQYTFTPPAAQIFSATLELSFRDQLWEGDDEDNLLNWRNEYAFGYTEGGDWDWGEVDTGTYSYNLGLSSLEDGIFQVTVASLLGNFYIVSSKVTIDYAPIPEPTTILLFSTGMAGLIGSRLRKKKK